MQAKSNGFEALGVAVSPAFRTPYIQEKFEASYCRSLTYSCGTAPTILTCGSAPGGGACRDGDNYEAALKVQRAWGFEAKFSTGLTKALKKFYVGNWKEKFNIDVIIGVSVEP